MIKTVRTDFSKKLMERLEADHFEWRKTHEPYLWRNPGELWDFAGVTPECDNAFKNARLTLYGVKHPEKDPAPMHATIKWDSKAGTFFFEITKA